MDETNLPNMQGRKILQVIPELNEGGAERTTIEVSEAIVNAGGRAIVASQGGRLDDELTKVGGLLVKMPLNTKNLIKMKINAKQIANLIHSKGIDIVHARSRAPAWSARWATQTTNTQFVTTYHGAYGNKNFLKTKYNSVMASGDRVIANSEWIATHVAHVHKVESSRIAMIPRGVDFSVFDPAKVESVRLKTVKTSWGIDTLNENLTVLLLPGRLTPWKGHQFVINALSILPDQIRNKIILVFAGDSDRKPRYTRSVQEKLKNLGLQSQIRFCGYTKDMPAAYLASDIVLTPSIRPEAFGRTAAEAGAMGKPVIACNHGGANEILEHNVTGLTVSPNNIQELSDAIGCLVRNNKNERLSMGNAAMLRIRQLFSKESLQYSTLRVYEELLRV